MTVKLVSPKFEKPDTEGGNGLSYRALYSTTKAESADLRKQLIFCFLSITSQITSKNINKEIKQD